MFQTLKLHNFMVMDFAVWMTDGKNVVSSECVRGPKHRNVQVQTPTFYSVHLLSLTTH